MNTEVVDAQTGSTIDPARQAIDALNNRHVRLMPVVKFPIEFMAPTTSSKCSAPPLIKYVLFKFLIKISWRFPAPDSGSVY
jgi:hypothetical protein